MHEALPYSDLNVPTGHAVHAVPFSPKKPGGHVQSVRAVEAVPAGPGGVTACAGHRVQLPMPRVGLYVSAGHAVHAVSLASPAYPGSHTHTSSAQRVHVPAGHDSHTSLAIRGWIVPGTHCVQSPVVLLAP